MKFGGKTDAPSGSWIIPALVLLTVWVFAPVRGFQFLNYDDGDYVHANPVVRAGLTWRGSDWAFTHVWASNWHPLTWLSHMADVSMFGLNPGMHHLTNLALHAANAVLLFLLLRTMTRSPWPSALVAALFAVHPLHVESVVWVAERKDVLSTFFALASLLAYARYARSGARRALGASLGLFGLGLLAKPMVVSLPLLMLLLDHWPLERLGEFSWRGQWGLVREKLPFFPLALASCAITVYAQGSGPALISLERLGMGARVLNAGVAYARYLAHMVWPADLAILYPRLPLPRLLALAGPSFLALSAISWAVVRERRRRPFLLVGWLWFLVSLVPVIGLVQVGGQSMADRYTYLPLVGPFMALVWLLECPGRAVRLRRGAEVAALLLLALLARRQVWTWKDSLTVFRHCQATSGAESAVPPANIAFSFMEQGRNAEALEELDRAIPAHSRVSILHELRGEALQALGRDGEAADAFLMALKCNPKAYTSAFLGGQLCSRLGRDREGLACFRRYLDLEPLRLAETLDPAGSRASSQVTRMVIGLMLTRMGRPEEAAGAFEAARVHAPADPQVLVNLGIALMGAGRPGDALPPLQRAAELAPELSSVHVPLGRALAQLGRKAEANREFAAALRLNPANPEAAAELRAAGSGRKASSPPAP
jgi:tetratricopeptide (TPR) repeat protein